MNILKKLRLTAYLTQEELAEKVGTSLLAYQQWESKEKKIPTAKVKKLCQILETSDSEITTGISPFDKFGGDHLPSHQTYYGDAALHFKSGMNLVVGITEREREKFSSFHQFDDDFFNFETLDNRIIFVRKDSISEIYLSSEAHDDYGPDEYDSINIFEPSENSWVNYENYFLSEMLGDREGMCPKVHKTILRLRRDKCEAVIDEITERATSIEWQLNSGKKRSLCFVSDEIVANAALPLSHKTSTFVTIGIEQGNYYDRTAIIPFGSVEYFSFPKHMYNRARLKDLSEELDG